MVYTILKSADKSLIVSDDFPETAGELSVALKTFKPVSPVTLNRLSATKSCVLTGII